MDATIVTVVLSAVGITLAVGGIIWQAGRHLATKADLAQFATRADLAQFVTKADLAQLEARAEAKFATKADLARFATKADLAQFEARAEAKFATKADLARFATKADLARFATREDLARFATREDLDRFATREDLERLRTDNEQAHAAITENVMAVARDLGENRQWIWDVSKDLREEIRKNDGSMRTIAESVALLAGRQVERDAAAGSASPGAQVQAEPS